MIQIKSRSPDKPHDSIVISAYFISFQLFLLFSVFPLFP